MASIIRNKKGFLVIKTNIVEMAATMDSPGICDHCNKMAVNGYLVSVLNHYLCEDCYKEWMGYAENYPEDQHIERKNMDMYIRMFHHAHITLSEEKAEDK